MTAYFDWVEVGVVPAKGELGWGDVIRYAGCEKSVKLSTRVVSGTGV